MVCAAHGLVCDVWHGRTATDLWNTIVGGPQRDRSVPPPWWLIGYRFSGRAPKVWMRIYHGTRSHPVDQTRISASALFHEGGDGVVGWSRATAVRGGIWHTRNRYELTSSTPFQKRHVRQELTRWLCRLWWGEGVSVDLYNNICTSAITLLPIVFAALLSSERPKEGYVIDFGFTRVS